MNARGFTLIEIMLSGIILSTVVLLASLSFSFFVDRWDENSTLLTESRQQAKNLTLLNRVFDGVADYYVYDQNNNLVLLFIGGEKEIIAITHKPWSGDDETSLIRLSVDEQAEFNVLRYQEWPITNDELYQVEDLAALLNKTSKLNIKIIEADDISFNFLGVESYEQFLGMYARRPQELDVLHAMANWRTKYNALEIKVLPLKVSLNINSADDKGRVIYSVPEFNNFKQPFLSN